MIFLNNVDTKSQMIQSNNISINYANCIAVENIYNIVFKMYIINYIYYNIIL